MPLLQNDEFYCNHIGASDADGQDIMAFSTRDRRGEGLVNYLQRFAFPDEEQGNMRTYLVRDSQTSELAGYFSLKAGLVSFNETKTETGADFDVVPGIEIANFAVNEGYIRKRPTLKGMGATIFSDFIQPLIEDVSQRVGVKVIYLFALPFERLIRRYEQYGFARLESDDEAELHKRLKPRYDEGCVFMYQMLSGGTMDER